MASGIWTSVSGAAAQAQSLDTIANNVANSDTVGFKKDGLAFKEYLSVLERDPPSVEVPRLPFKDKDFYPIDGRDQSHVVVSGTYTNFKQGPIRVTQNPLDVAMDGPGFLEVSTPEGTRWTRAGSLKLGADGKLVTTDGFPVLSARAGGLSAEASAQDAPGSEAARFINLRDLKGPLSITEKGDIYSGPTLVAKLSIAEMIDANKLRKMGASLFKLNDPNNLKPAEKTKVQQGMLEYSNVNPIEEMTNLIQANRLYEEDMKALKTFGDLMGREATEVGKF